MNRTLLVLQDPSEKELQLYVFITIQSLYSNYIVSIYILKIKNVYEKLRDII